MMYDPNNIFARILRGEIPAKKVFETEHSLAFHDAFPKAPIHILVIPKNPYTTFHEFAETAEPEEIVDFYGVVNSALCSFNLHLTGYKLQVNTGRDGGQEVPHFHVHIFGGKGI